MTKKLTDDIIATAHFKPISEFRGVDNKRYLFLGEDYDIQILNFSWIEDDGTVMLTIDGDFAHPLSDYTHFAELLDFKEIDDEK